MGERLSGVIKTKKTQSTPYGERWSFLIGSTWASVFANKIKDEEIKKTFQALKDGDEVEFEVQKNDKGFLNIVGLIQSTPPTQEQGDPAQGAEEKPSYQAKEPQETKIRSMAFSYVKDLIVAGKIEAGEWGVWADVITNYIATGEYPGKNEQ